MLTAAIFRFTDTGKEYCKERLERMKALKPNAYEALEKEFLLNREDIFYSKDWWMYEDEYMKTTESNGSITYHFKDHK